ncbi:14 kDa phosphohistidine phosphatase-like [Pectinophora gossypiella]|uniref:Sex-regulated protein janus-A n=1 Tax=Pectinophora gossypiella TaxID=13191 RepID=A0A1E1VX92_PECGO|nr:14 kDa phosphohistidine phosphatase-like [Pectinophora gossypiella]
MIVNRIIYNIQFCRSFIVSGHLRDVVKAPTLFGSAQNMSSKALDSVPKVDIDPDGVFKYILIKVYDKEKDNVEPSTTIVRGYKRHNYHSDIYDEVQDKLKPLDCEPIGGGRISHQPDDKKIHIYGYSQGYGKADHEVTARLIKDAFPNYTITISDEGY